jgi:hypothetical protein
VWLDCGEYVAADGPKGNLDTCHKELVMLNIEENAIKALVEKLSGDQVVRVYFGGFG